jgi:hypothetical protein
VKRKVVDKKNNIFRKGSACQNAFSVSQSDVEFLKGSFDERRG